MLSWVSTIYLHFIFMNFISFFCRTQFEIWLNRSPDSRCRFAKYEQNLYNRRSGFHIHATGNCFFFFGIYGIPVILNSVCIVRNRLINMFLFQFTDWQRFYLTHDINILLDVMKSELFYVKTSWNVPGRPLICVTLTRAMLFRKFIFTSCKIQISIKLHLF